MVNVPDVAQRLAALMRSYLFADLDRTQCEPLALASTTRSLVRGEYVFHVGDPANEIDVMMSGEVKAAVVSEDGEEVVHFVHGPGMTFGEAGFFSAERTRVLEVVAVTPAVLLRLDRRHLVPFMEQHVQVKDRVLEGLASNSRWQTTMISTLATRPLMNRLVLRLLELADTGNERVDDLAVVPKISQSTLAAMVGASRENVNRALAVLSQRGYLRSQAGGYVLLDEAGLRRELAKDWPQVGRHDRRGRPV